MKTRQLAFPIITRFVTLALSLLTTQLSAQPKAGSEYTGKNRVLSLRIPKAPNPFGVVFQLTVLDRGDSKYDRVMLHAADFGQYINVGARIMPGESVAAMDKDSMPVVLATLSEGTLASWRSDLKEPPVVVSDSLFESSHGATLLRVYRLPGGSTLRSARGARPTAANASDAHIVSITARRGAQVVFVLAEDDSDPTGTASARSMAGEVWATIRVLAPR